MGRLTTQTSGSSLPGRPPLPPLPVFPPLTPDFRPISPPSPRLLERDRPYSVKLPLCLRRRSGWPSGWDWGWARRAANAAFTRVAHSLRFQIRPGPVSLWGGLTSYPPRLVLLVLVPLLRALLVPRCFRAPPVQTPSPLPAPPVLPSALVLLVPHYSCPGLRLRFVHSSPWIRQ